MYEDQYWYWELVETFQKALMTGALVVIAPGTSAQIFIGILLVLFHMVWTLKASPYVRDADDWMQFSCSLAILLTVLCGLYLKTTGDGLSSDDVHTQDIMLVSVFSIVPLLWIISFILAIPPLRKRCCCNKCEGSIGGVHHGGTVADHGQARTRKKMRKNSTYQRQCNNTKITPMQKILMEENSVKNWGQSSRTRGATGEGNNSGNGANGGGYTNSTKVSPTASSRLEIRSFSDVSDVEDGEEERIQNVQKICNIVLKAKIKLRKGGIVTQKNGAVQGIVMASNSNAQNGTDPTDNLQIKVIQGDFDASCAVTGDGVNNQHVDIATIDIKIYPENEPVPPMIPLEESTLWKQREEIKAAREAAAAKSGGKKRTRRRMSFA